MSGVGITYLWTSKKFPAFVLLEGRRGDYEVYAPERTCRFEGAPDEPPTCSACGFETGIYDCDWYDDEPKYVYAGKYCSECGAKVVEE